MISLQKPNKILSKKRKWDDHDDDDDDDDGDNPAEDQIPLNPKKIQPVFDSHLHLHRLQAQSPLDWQRCLDIKSGQIYFYNTRTNKRASGYDDPVRSSLDQPSNDNRAPMSLELELNLPCQSLEHASTTICSNDHFTSSGTIKDGRGRLLTRPPSWLTFEAEEQQEMVTAVCRKCYMLVMMCKSSPSCPNCKFVHPMMSNPFNQEVDRS